VRKGVLDLGKDLPPPPGSADIRPDKGGFLKMTSKGIEEDFAQDLPKARPQDSRRDARSHQRRWRSAPR